MADSIQDAINLLRSMRPMFDPTEDYICMASAEERMVEVADQREEELGNLSADVKETLRKLEVARASSSRPPSLPTEEQHVQILHDIDAAKLSLIKSINDAESIHASREAELTGLMAECAKLEASDPALEHELDSTPLKLAFYTSLGFTPVSDKDGNVNKMLIRSKSGEVHTVTFERNRMKADYSKLLWDLAST